MHAKLSSSIMTVIKTLLCSCLAAKNKINRLQMLICKTSDKSMEPITRRAAGEENNVFHHQRSEESISPRTRCDKAVSW